jgi:ketosteroid isomerase-like protein
MITTEFIQQFAQEWIASWNAHDLDRILSHYTDDFTIETPMAAILMPGNSGIVKGKDAVRAYWTIGLERIPDLEFELKDVLAGINAVTIYYVNKATGRRSAEIMFFNEAGKVERAFVHYA